MWVLKQVYTEIRIRMIIKSQNAADCCTTTLLILPTEGKSDMRGGFVLEEHELVPAADGIKKSDNPLRS